MRRREHRKRGDLLERRREGTSLAGRGSELLIQLFKSELSRGPASSVQGQMQILGQSDLCSDMMMALDEWRGTCC